ncbi:MAG: hypothetical protein PHE88_07700 [Elusimicrobia bacterium]|nr:hypothetical protein [Elusimicrobiota bacterium]
MTYKEKMLLAIKGESLGKIPYAPRLDLWYNANKRAGTLPVKYRNATLVEITDELNIGYHAIIPNFKDLRNQDEDIHRAFGIYNLWTMPYKTQIENTKITVNYSGEETIVEYHTPAGNIRTKVLYDEGMKKAGITITHVTEYAIKSHEDFKAIGYIFDNAVVVPNYEGYSEFAGKIGGRGISAGFISLSGSPMHLLQRELMPMDLFFYELHDHPDEIKQCADSIGKYFDKVFDVSAECPAEVLLFGANYDSRVTYPPFFTEYIEPWLKKYAGILHSKKKFLITHTDGENTGLLDNYINSEIDIADSICPAPMTKLTFRQVRDYFNGRITIMGGIPSVCLLKNSMTDNEFEKYLDNFFTEIGSKNHLILGISDTTPPDAVFERIIKIGEYIQAL